MFYMQREPKKTKLPVTTVIKGEKPTISKVSKPEKPVISKKKPVIVADKAPQKSKSELKTKISIAAESKTKKTAAIAPALQNKKEPAKPTVSRPQKKEKATAPVSTNKQAKAPTIVLKKKAAPKTILIKPETKTKKAKTAAKKIEIVVPPMTPKPVKKKIKPIGSAIVRGKSGRYDFEVFPIDAELKDGSAIYVISKRVTDKSGKGHHKFVCIGQTESLLGDLKKHKKDKCIKQYKANVICLLREEDEKNRLRIETDLRQAHTIVCNQK
jgi:hypothetical protein